MYQARRKEGKNFRENYRASKIYNPIKHAGKGDRGEGKGIVKKYFILFTFNCYDYDFVSYNEYFAFKNIA